MKSHCVIECPNCVVEKIHLFFHAGETESVFVITNWSTRIVIHHGFGDTSRNSYVIMRLWIKKLNFYGYSSFFWE
jgi:hypothetical protein